MGGRIEVRFLIVAVFILALPALVTADVLAGDLAETRKTSESARAKLAELQGQKLTDLRFFEQSLNIAAVDQRATVVAQISARHALIARQSRDAISHLGPVEDSFARLTSEQILPAGASSALRATVNRNLALGRKLDQQSAISKNEVMEMQTLHLARVAQMELDAPFRGPVDKPRITTRDLINSENFTQILAERAKHFGRLEVLQTRLQGAKAEDRATIIKNWESNAAREFFSAVSATSNLETNAK